MENQEHIFNKTFNAGDHSGFFNACVGENGFVDKRTYGIGFAEAVDILTSALIARDERANLNTLIYPICFCARHHIELFLKAQIEQISKIRGISPIIPNKPGVSISSTHDLGILWTVFANTALATDRRLADPVAQLKEFIQDIAQIDPTGQTFRYPSNTESQKHLVATPVINILSLRSRFMTLVEKIEAFENLSDALSREYSDGVYTSKLSRADLEYIALNLPPYASWAIGDEMSLSKNKIRQLFNLSSNDFNRAVDAIKTHPEFASHIGIVIAIDGLSERAIDNFNRVLDEELSIDGWEIDEMATVEALYEIAAPIYLSEQFNLLQLHFKREFKFERYTQGQLGHRARTIPRLIAGLRKIGQIHLASYAEKNLVGKKLITRLEKENEEFKKRYPRITLSTSSDNMKTDGAKAERSPDSNES